MAECAHLDAPLLATFRCAECDVMRNAILSVLFGICGVSTNASESAVQVKLSAAFAFAPGNVTVRAIVVPDERNELLMISAESIDYLRRSTVQLEGKDEA